MCSGCEGFESQGLPFFMTLLMEKLVYLTRLLSNVSGKEITIWMTIMLNPANDKLYFNWNV
jgi:hypothetical protein